MMQNSNNNNNKNYYVTYNNGNDYVNDLTIYFILVIIMSPSTIFLLFKRNFIYKNTNLIDSFKKLTINDISNYRKQFNVVVSTLLIIINVNLWYYLLTSLDMSQFGNSSPISTKHQLYDQNSFNIINQPFLKKFDTFKFVNTPIKSYYSSNDGIASDEDFGGDLNDCASLTLLDQDTIEVATFKQQLYDSHSNVKNPQNGITNEIFELEIIRNKAMILVSNLKFVSLALTFYDQPRDKSDNEILKERWTKKSTSVVWLDKYKVYYMVSQISYSQSGIKAETKISLLYAQIFNKNWQQQFNFQFPHNKDLMYPNILPIRIEHNARRKLSLDPDANYGPDEPYLIVRHFKKDKQSGDDQKPDEYDEEPIVMYTAKVKDLKFNSRVHIFRPLQMSSNVNNGIRLNVKDDDLKDDRNERNWIPFFNSFENENENDDANNQHINFMYSFNPLTVAKCDIETGDCTIKREPAAEETPEVSPDTKVEGEVPNLPGSDSTVQGKPPSDSDTTVRGKTPSPDSDATPPNPDSDTIVKAEAPPPDNKNINIIKRDNDIDDSITKSTQLLPIPNHLLPHNKITKDKLYWFGFISSKYNDCNNCLHEIIRPKAVLMSYSLTSQSYSLDYVSSYVDFNINPTPWTATSADQTVKCTDERSYLTPNGIVWWNFNNDESETRGDSSPNDYLGLTITESSQYNKFIMFKGWLKHLNKILTASSDSTASDGDHDYKDLQLMECSIQNSNHYCKLAGEKYHWS